MNIPTPFPRPTPSPASGGVTHIHPRPWGSVRFALEWIEALSPEDANFIWISEESLLYPAALAGPDSPISLSRFLIVRTRTPEETWSIALESAQTGLFDWVLARPKRACVPAHLRRLQLSAEKTGTQVLLLGKLNLPHWTLKHSIAVDGEKIHGSDSVLSRARIFAGLGGERAHAHAQSQPVRAPPRVP